jgi:hypothetical protein
MHGADKHRSFVETLGENSYFNILLSGFKDSSNRRTISKRKKIKKA